MSRDASLYEKVGTTAESGQAITEYILLVAVVTGFYLMIFRFLNSTSFGTVISNAVTTPYMSVYTYGYPAAKGFDDGGPLNHPRAVGGTGNFRIFINPDKQ
jgi:hypothetical protein